MPVKLRIRVKWPSGQKVNHRITLEDGNTDLPALMAAVNACPPGPAPLDWATSIVSLNGNEPIAVNTTPWLSGDLVFVLVGKNLPACHAGDGTAPMEVDNDIQEAIRRSLQDSTPVPPAAPAVPAALAAPGAPAGTLHEFPRPGAPVNSQVSAAAAPSTADRLRSRRFSALESTVLRSCSAGPLVVSASGPSPDLYRSAAVFAVVHALLLEAGFAGAELPAGWLTGAGLKTDYTPPYMYRVQARATLRCVPFGGTLVVCGGIEGGAVRSEAVVAKVDCAAAVSVVVAAGGRQLETAQLYMNLPGLVRSLKNDFVSRFLNLARTAAGLPECNCLAALVPELKMLVLSFLPAADLCRLATVSREFGSLSSSPALWRQLYRGHPKWVSLQVLPTGRSEAEMEWKGLYRSAFLKELGLKRRDQARRQEARAARFGQLGGPFGVPPHHQQQPQPVPGINYIPGVVGGDYDLYPWMGPGAGRGGFPPGAGAGVPLGGGPMLGGRGRGLGGAGQLGPFGRGRGNGTAPGFGGFGGAMPRFL